MDIKNLVSKQIWEDRYKKGDETVEGNIERVARYISKDEEEFKEFYNVMCKRLFLPAGRTMSNSGIGKSLTLNNCFTLNLVPDSMEGIFDYVKNGALTQKAGGGTGYNFSLLRPNGTPTSNDAVASGVVSFMNAFDSQTHTVLQGSRRGANMGCLSIYHPDILEFLESKSWDEGKLTHFNLSVLIDDKFMRAVENDEIIQLHYPCMSEDGKFIDDPSEWVVSKDMKAKELWDKIISKAYNTGEYGVLYYDTMNRDNNIKYMETIVTTNPCGEYLSGVVTVDGEVKDYLGCCNLGSLFLHNFVENPFTVNAKVNWDLMKTTIKTGVKILDNIIDINNYPLKNFEDYQRNIRAIGLGITGLADMIVMLGMKYGSKESIDFVDNLMNFISYNAYNASCILAKENYSFNLLNREEFIKSNFIQKHIAEYNSEDTDWKNLTEDILKYGVRNARLISIAPTGTLSLTYGENCSSGLEPIFSLEYDRKIKIGGQEDKDIQIYKMKDYAYSLWECVENKAVSKDLFVTAMDLDVQDHINILSKIAFHTDMSCSKTINIPTDYPYEKTKEIYKQCWENGIKGVTIFRPNEVRQGILLTENHKTKEDGKELKRGEWEERPNEIIGIDRKVYSGCGKVKLHIKVVPSEKRIFDFYITNSSPGGCRLNLEALTITLSGMLRLGGDLSNIKQAFRGCGVCPSFTAARKSGKKVSKGSSCATAIYNILEEVENDLKNERLKELKIIGYYDNHNKSAVVDKREDKIDSLTQEEKDFISEYGEVAFAKKFHKCPVCGNDDLYTADGCMTDVTGCGWTKC